MKEFMTLREFLLLKNPTDRPQRSVHRDAYLPRSKRNSLLEEGVDRYDIAKASWEEFGEDGPPVGSTVQILEPGHGGDVGMVCIIGGIYEPDPRFFYVTKEDNSVSLVCRETWFVHMKVAS